MTTDVIFQLPDDLLLALRVTPDQFRDELRLAAALKFVELGRLSSGTAARLAGVPVPVLLSRLADYGLAAFRMSAAEVQEDARRA